MKDYSDKQYDELLYYNSFAFDMVHKSFRDEMNFSVSCSKLSKANMFKTERDLYMWRDKMIEEYHATGKVPLEVQKFEYKSQSDNTNSSSSKYTPKCPTCNSPNVAPISEGRKAIGLLAFGLASKSVGKSYRCKNCGYYW